MNSPGKKISILAALLLCAGCAAMPGQKTAHKAPPVNLAGFPPAYKEGYTAACDGSKNAKRYKADKQYQQGWRDGEFACKKTAAKAKPRTAWAGIE